MSPEAVTIDTYNDVRGNQTVTVTTTVRSTTLAVDMPS